MDRPHRQKGIVLIGVTLISFFGGWFIGRTTSNQERQSLQSALDKQNQELMILREERDRNLQATIRAIADVEDHLKEQE